MNAIEATASAISDPAAARRRWLALGVIGIAQLMVVLDLTVMNIALPSAQRALHFTTADRQWVVTAYSLAFGSLLLAGGKLGDLIGRRTTFLIGLVGFAGVSAIGGASVDFPMLVAARASQGVFAAILVPSSLALLITMFTEPKDRARAFGVFGAIATAGGAIGLLLGGALTDYLSWRWTLYVNLAFAAVAFLGGILLLDRQRTPKRFQLDVRGLLLASGGLFGLVFGFSNAAAHGWHASSTWGFLAAGGVLLAAFALWIRHAADPLLPPRILLDRNRGGANVAVFVASLCLFATLFFLTFYLQRTLNYSPIKTGLAFLPISACLAIAANLSTIVFMPKVGPRPVVTAGLLIASAAMAWLAHLGPHASYSGGVLGPIIAAGLGLGMVVAPAINTGTYGVAPPDAGIASATVTVSQQLGASIGTSHLNRIFATAVASYITTHGSGAASKRSYTATTPRFWWTRGIAAGGGVVAALTLRSGPLVRRVVEIGQRV